MNPDLEAPALWSGVHHWLMTEIARSLAPQLRPRYFVAIEEATIREGYLEIRTVTKAISATRDRPAHTR